MTSRSGILAAGLLGLALLSACAPRAGVDTRAGVSQSVTSGRVTGTAGVGVSSSRGVRPHASLGVDVCRNPSPFHVSAGWFGSVLGLGLHC